MKFSLYISQVINNVNVYQSLTKWKTEKMMFDDVLSWDLDRKERKKEEKLIQNKCVSSYNHRMKKEEGATAAASHLPSLTAGRFVGPVGQRLMENKPSGNPH